MCFYLNFKQLGVAYLFLLVSTSIAYAEEEKDAERV